MSYNSGEVVCRFFCGKLGATALYVGTISDHKIRGSFLLHIYTHLFCGGYTKQCVLVLVPHSVFVSGLYIGYLGSTAFPIYFVWNDSFFSLKQSP